jgi:tetratricopeptide (TPR) repeat protein
METKIPYYYGEARKIYSQSVDAAAHTESTGIGLESLLEGEMRGWVKCGNADKAKEVLGEFSALRNPRWDPSFYAKECADMLYENKPIKYQEFVSDWLQKHPIDKQTAVLMARLALSYYRTEQYMKALPLFETLRNEHLQDFQREDAEAFKRGHGGYYDFIMEGLMMIYLRRGEFEEAKKVQQELKKHLPNSKNINKLEQIDMIPDLVDMPSAADWREKWHTLFKDGAEAQNLCGDSSSRQLQSRKVSHFIDRKWAV